MRRILLTALPAVLLTGMVAASGLLGWFVRPTSDDYRLAVFTRRGGVPGIVEEFYLRLTGRVGNAVLAGAVYSWPSVGPRVLPAIVLCALVGALFLLLRNGARAVGAELGARGCLAAAAALAVIMFWGQPHPYQTLYWAAGVITHVVPPIVLILLAALALGPAGRSTLFAPAAAVVVAALVTVSEPVVPICLVAGGLLLAGAALERRVSRLGIALVAGAGGGLAFLWTTPGLADRTRKEGSTLTLETFDIALRTTWASLGEYFGRPWFYAAFAVGILLGMAAPPARRIGIRPWPLLGAFAVAYGIQCGVRFGFGEPPVTLYRIWFNFAFVWVLVLLWYGFCVARWARGAAAVRWLAGGVVAACAVAWGGAFLTLEREMVPRAAAWDAQRDRIELEIAEGTTVRYRPLPIDLLAEPWPETPRYKDWMSWSVAEYFGAERIRLLPRRPVAG